MIAATMSTDSMIHVCRLCLYATLILFCWSVAVYASLPCMLCYMMMYAYHMNMNMLLCLNLAMNLCEHTAMFNHG